MLKPLSINIDYYPFGAIMPGRSYNANSYRYAYNGMLKDDEVYNGSGNSYTTYFRQHDTRLGRWFSVDPEFQPWQSPYTSMDNNPIMFTDPLGDSPVGQFFSNMFKGGFSKAKHNLGLKNNLGSAVSMSGGLRLLGAVLNTSTASVFNANTMGPPTSGDDKKKQQEQNRQQVQQQREINAQAQSKSQNTSNTSKSNSNNIVKYTFPVGISPFIVTEKTLAAAGTGIMVSYGNLSITASKNAPFGFKGQSISSSGFALGGGIGSTVELFSRVSGQVYLNKPFSGSSIEELFRNTKIIHAKSGGTLIKYRYIQGFDSKGNLLWHSNTKGTSLGWGVGSDRYPVNLK